MSDQPEQQYLTPAEAGKLFPRPLSEYAVRRRITKGIQGVKLAASYDGRRYWVRPEAVPAFLKELADVRETRVKFLSEEIRSREERTEMALRILGDKQYKRE